MDTVIVAVGVISLILLVLGLGTWVFAGLVIVRDA